VCLLHLWKTVSNASSKQKYFFNLFCKYFEFKNFYPFIFFAGLPAAIGSVQKGYRQLKR
jgi:hypothetical protein